ncbi:MAG: hypothetical protein WAZ27_00060 [Minisyncoccia bacterium]
MSALVILALTSFALHLLWERMHIGLYTAYDAMKGKLPVFIYATLGDVLYTFLAITLISLFKGSILWFLDAGLSDYIGLALLGFYIAVFVEYKAFALKRWEYTASMPKFLGLGATPLIQMTILLPLSVSISIALSRLL